MTMNGMNKSIKVSVIIPVYNVEQYIERCARSLMEQTMKEGIEFIFINDCTPDGSMDILQQVIAEYPERKNQVRIITMERNSGQAAVRRRGMLEAKGEYQIHCDSDDWVEIDMYEKMYEKAIVDNADVVSCNFIMEKEDGRKQIVENLNNPDPRYHINYVSQHIWWTLWCRLIRTDVIRKFEILPIWGMNMWEDVFVNLRVYYYANYLSHVAEPLYHYDESRDGRIINKRKEEYIIQQQISCIVNLEKFFDSVRFNASMFLYFRKCDIKKTYLQKQPIDLKGFVRCFPEVKKYVYDSPRFYKFCWELAARGYVLPYKLYIRFSEFKRGALGLST